MPGTTPRGFPYPLPTEPVAEGAQAIRNLAEAIDAKSGIIPLAMNASGSALPRSIPFTLSRSIPSGLLIASFAAFPSSSGIMAVSVDIDAVTICGIQLEVLATAGVHYTLPLAAGVVTALAAGAHNLTLKNGGGTAAANMAANDRVTAVLLVTSSTVLLERDADDEAEPEADPE